MSEKSTTTMTAAPAAVITDFAYPAELPVAARHDEILAALRSHPVIIVCGDTGSGKTTQLPKMACEAGCAARGRLVACTQPRRLAAVTMAERVAAELKSPIGGFVGFQHRYGRKVSRDTHIKFMTDGVLLAETRADPLLRRYDCIIVDEAHERSLNVDFLLGILKRILARRRDLKVIVSSATMDTERFSAFFDNAPMLTVPGRLYPIETRYMPPPSDEERDLARDVADAVDSLPNDGDVLVFLPGERDIREAADVLEGRRGMRDEIIPLLATLPAGEQQRAFRLGPSRRIILATNVAETSVTIPGIRYVVDSGLARISRYVHRTQVQRLQVEPVSQASARQRTGRCGRIGPGTCIRLYSEEDFLTRDAYTPPEILRSSLAGVILTMLDLGLGDISRFPFLEPPRPAMIAEGFRELIELGAVGRDRNGEPCLTPTGRKLARIPVEPRLARMLVAASEFGVLPKALPIVAAMSCDDPKRRPVEEREKAQQAHAPFRDVTSDFLGTLKLWTWWQEQSAELSQSKLRKLCKATYLSYPKMREWSDLVRQLTALCERLGLDAKNDSDESAYLHRSLLTGLLGRIGHWDSEEREYRGSRGVRFSIHPSSSLAKAVRRQPPEWIMAGELVDTGRLMARSVTGVDIEWIEPAAGTLCRHHVHSPMWDAQSGFVRATEQVTLYGLVIVPARRCDFSRYDPILAREMFIRQGLVGGEFPQPPPQVRENNALLDALRRFVEKIRKSELFPEDRLIAHFQRAIPADICSAPALKKWLRRATGGELEAFRLKKSDWWPDERESDRDFPNEIRIGTVRMRLSYRHTPDDPDTDGLTCSVLKSEAAALKLWRADWLVPGLLPEKLTWMISVLPTAQRRVLTPIADTVSGLLAKLRPGTEPLGDAVVRTVAEEWGFRISPEAWQRARLPNHLRARFLIRDDETRRVLAASRDLDDALARVGIASTATPSLALEDALHTAWDFGTLSDKAANSRAGWKLEHYQALHDEGGGVTLRLYTDADEARRVHDEGVLRLYLLAQGTRAIRPFDTRRLPLSAALYLKDVKYAADAIAKDILVGATKAALVRGLPPVRDEATFLRRLDERTAERVSVQADIAKRTLEALVEATELLDAAERDGRLPVEAAEAVQTQLLWLVHPGFPRTTPYEVLKHYPRYLKGAAIRMERARVSPSSDRAKEARFAPYWERYRNAIADKTAARPSPETLERYRWMLEEYRISIFAQELHTPEPISAKRLDECLGAN